MINIYTNWTSKPRVQRKKSKKCIVIKNNYKKNNYFNAKITLLRAINHRSNSIIHLILKKFHSSIILSEIKYFYRMRKKLKSQII
jgi:hypothetical protein